MTPTVKLLADGIEGRAVVVLRSGLVGPHSGIAYRIHKEAPRLLHLEWHLQLLNEPLPDDGYWVRSALGRAAKIAVASRAALVAERYRDGALAYGFDVRGVELHDDGTVYGGSTGVTCASLVALVYESAGCPLVNLETWDSASKSRKGQDEAAQKHLVAQLATDHPAHAARVAKEVGCCRLRSQEVAAASGFKYRPVSYDEASKAGVVVLQQAPDL